MTRILGARRAVAATACLLSASACALVQPSPTAPPPCPSEPPDATQTDAILESVDRAVVTTNKGTFTIRLHVDDAPIAVANFVLLARCGFYEGIRFHRVLAGFVAQAGDPHTDPDHAGRDPRLIGTGGPPYRFDVEQPPAGLDYAQYSVSMANSGEPPTNGSQFFIALTDLTGRLPRDFTIFGQVVDGTDVVDAIGQVPVDGPAGLPLEEVVIERVEIVGPPEPSPS